MSHFRWLIAAVLIMAAPWALADYPDRPIKLVVPFPAGSASDQIARQVTAEMAKELKQPIVVDNRAGAQTLIGLQAALAAPADGYTLVLFGSTPAINATLIRKLPYDTLRDLTFIGGIAESPLVLVAAQHVKADTLPQLVALAQAQPGKVSYGYGATSAQIAGEAFAALTKIDMLDVAYKGTPQVLADLLGGTVDVTFFDYLLAMQQIRAGKLKALAVSSNKRFPLAPDLAPVADTYPGFDVNVFWGLAAPGTLPPEVVARLSGSLMRALRSEEITRRFAEQGIAPRISTPEQFAASVRYEIDNWGRMIKAAGIPLQD